MIQSRDRIAVQLRKTRRLDPRAQRFDPNADISEKSLTVNFHIYFLATIFTISYFRSACKSNPITICRASTKIFGDYARQKARYSRNLASEGGGGRERSIIILRERSRDERERGRKGRARRSGERENGIHVTFSFGCQKQASSPAAKCDK